MLTEPQKKLLDALKTVPEWHRALLYEQFAALTDSASSLSMVVCRLAQGFADSKLRPRLYIRRAPYCMDRTTEQLHSAAASLGRALAALEMLAVLSDALQQDLQHTVQFAHDLHYRELETLCTDHGTKEDTP